MKKVILNRPKRTKRSPMTKNTHSITDIEGLIYEKLDIMQNGHTMADKKKARTAVIRLEKMLKDIDYKIINKDYPERLKGLPDDKPMDKKELYKLIDSVETNEEYSEFTEPYDAQALMLEGVYTKGSLEQCTKK